jgi:hypothetical protein
MCVCSTCCRKTSERTLYIGAPMANPSVWMCVCPLNVKKFCLVMVSYHVNSSRAVFFSAILFSSDLLRMCLVSSSGMFEYMFCMSRDANVCDGWMGVVLYKLCEVSYVECIW